MNKRKEIRTIVERVFSDGGQHSSREISELCRKKGIELDQKNSAVNNLLFSLKQEGYLSSGEERGTYILANKAIDGEVREDCSPISDKKNIDREKEEIVGNNKNGMPQTYSQIDWDNFVVLLPKSRRTGAREVAVKENGEIRVNSKLQGELKTRKLEIILSKDCKTLFLRPNGENCHILTKAGIMRSKDMAEMLRDHGRKFPVHYTVQWEECYQLWKGVINEY